MDLIRIIVAGAVALRDRRQVLVETDDHHAVVDDEAAVVMLDRHAHRVRL